MGSASVVEDGALIGRVASVARDCGRGAEAVEGSGSLAATFDTSRRVLSFALGGSGSSLLSGEAAAGANGVVVALSSSRCSG